ncbi:abc transporter substrate-binding protein [Leptolyngbya sp. Heron Island J]|uniref:ABC transporter permease n=1 Tax=Leptolyngbya sp. Heron Island J TaxID=1385935 RepID=UPI0003B9EA87|nr:ABC transporter permease [Leptolyngbya sp. Heron Island J]ESA37194.1 abc transporter substrate-binding protein [Leptolyngbya sp. Heron Island J]
MTTLTWEDTQALAEQAPSATIISACRQQKAQVVYAEHHTSTTVDSTDLAYPDTRNTLLPASGQFFTEEELTVANSVAVIAPTVQRHLFPDNINSVGETIRNGCRGIACNAPTTIA